MTNRFVSIMEQIGIDCLKALSFVEKYLPEVAVLVETLFPGQTAVADGIVNSVSLIQKAVVTIEQKMAAGGAAAGTGTQKLADVVSIVSPTVTQLLTAEGLKVDTAYIQKLTNAVVDILNVQAATVPVAPAPATA